MQMRFALCFALWISSTSAFGGAFAMRKVQVQGFVEPTQQTTGFAKVKTDYPLLVVVNKLCLAMAGDRLSSLGFRVKHNRSPLAIEALHATFAGDLASLERAVASEPCIIGVTDNSPVTSQAVDPRQSEQAFGHEFAKRWASGFFITLFGASARRRDCGRRFGSAVGSP